MADGAEIRTGIDSETVRGLLLINGGGAVALLAFLAGIIEKPDLALLARAIILGVFTFQLGLVAAVMHNHFRRLCSLEYAKKPACQKCQKYRSGFLHPPEPLILCRQAIVAR